MVKSIQKIGVLLSSPGDLSDERDAIAQVCSEINLDHGRHEGYYIDLIRWETHTWSSKGERGQAVINKQLGIDFDIYFGMLWSKMGTPTGAWRSGTEEEFRIAQEANAESGSPELMFFFSDSPVSPSSVRPEQVAQINDFRAELQSLGVLHFSFSDATDLKIKARRHLLAIIKEVLAKRAADVSLQVDQLPASPLSDPLAAWHELIASDPLVNMSVLMRDATHHMKHFNHDLDRLKQEAERLARSMNKAVAKLKVREQSPAAELAAKAKIAVELNDALLAYVGHLLTHIPSMQENFDVGLTKAARAVDLAAAHAPDERAFFPFVRETLNGMGAGLSKLSSSVAQSGPVFASVFSEPPMLRISARQVEALHQDLTNFLSRALDLIGYFDRALARHVAPPLTQ